MLLVELANEYELTTADAIDLCLAAGIPADSSATVLDANQVTRWRELADKQRAYHLEQMASAAPASPEPATAPAPATHTHTGVIDPTDGARHDSAFGPIPPAPWEAGSDPPGGGVAPPTGTGAAADLGPGWGMAPAEGAAKAQVSVYAAGSLALSVVALIFPFVGALLAIPVALFARKQIEGSRGALTGERLANTAIVVSVVGVVLWVGLVVTITVRDNQAREARLRPPDIQVDTKRIGWDEISKGDCVRIPHADLSVSEWQGVSCAGPHESEVFATFEMNNPTGQRFPGNGAIIPQAKLDCEQAFARYIGRPYDRSELKIGVFFPTQHNWVEQTDRRYGCIVYQDNYNLINGSLQNADR